MNNSLTAPERETVITFNDADETAHIFTWQRPVITRLGSNPAATETATHRHGTSVGAEFTIPRELVSFRTKRVTRELTDEQRAANRERLTHGREARLRSVSSNGNRECEMRHPTPTPHKG